MTLAIPIFLSIVNLPKTDPTYRSLVATLTRQVDGLLPLQDPSTGLWRTLLVDPESYVETSGSAGFAGGILMAIRLVSWLLITSSRVSFKRVTVLTDPRAYWTERNISLRL